MPKIAIGVPHAHATLEAAVFLSDCLASRQLVVHYLLGWLAVFSFSLCCLDV